MGASPERREFLDFTSNHLEVEFGYLVPAASRISSSAYVDRPGIRVAVVARGTPDIYFTGALKSAALVRAAGLPPALEVVGSRKADLLAGLKPAMYGVSPRLPGSRVLDAPGSEEAGMAMPKARPAAAGG